MYAQVEKPKENKSKAVANFVLQKKNGTKQGFIFADNRTKVIPKGSVQPLAIDSISQALQKMQTTDERDC